MANFSSKKLMMKNPSGQKKKINTQYSPSKPGTFKNAFREARADGKKLLCGMVKNILQN